MKRIEAIIRPTRVGKVCTALEKTGNRGLVISHVESCGGREGIQYLVRGRTYKADLMTKARVEVIVKDRELDNIIKVIRDAAFTGDMEDGNIFVHAMEDAIRIMSGESAEAAV